MLLCHKDSFVGKLIPKDWCGTLYTSEEIISDVTSGKYKVV